jgi:glutamate-1-semialdehyde 2,1-aminomutase
MTTPGDITQLYTEARPKSKAWYARATATLGGAVGHDVRHFEPVPMYIARGQGSRKWDVDGNEYIDFLLGNGALLLGHSPPEVVEAIQRTLVDGTHFGNDHPLHIEWGEVVKQLVPSAEKVRFVNSGTEATLLALRLGRAFTGKSVVVRFEGHFHGWHDGVVHGFQPPFDADGSLGVPPQVWDSFVTAPANDLDSLDEILSSPDSDIAAAIIEPSGASWGRIPIDPGFLRGLRELTKKHGVVLIFDEVVTGFRFSPGGAEQLFGITPDLSCFAKIVAGGMPGGAVSGGDEIMSLFDFSGDAVHDRHQRVVHQGTFNGAPLSAAAGVAYLKQIATGEPTKSADALAAQLRETFEDVLERHGIAGYVYGISSTFHVFFETDVAAAARASRRSDLHTADPQKLKGMSGELISRYQLHLRHHGVDNMSSTGGVLSSVHTQKDIEEATDAFEKTVVALAGEKLILKL